jgi:hypothetical protein
MNNSPDRFIALSFLVPIDQTDIGPLCRTQNANAPGRRRDLVLRRRWRDDPPAARIAVAVIRGPRRRIDAGPRDDEGCVK